MFYLYFVAAVALIVSLLKDPGRTGKAFVVAVRRFLHILPSILTMVILVSGALYLLPERLISCCLAGKSKLVGVGMGALLGSVTLMPGFIAFPLAGILRDQGVPYMVLSAFTTTLMMVGVLTYPVERAYFGRRVTIARNALSFLIALAVAFATGVFFKEVF